MVSMSFGKFNRARKELKEASLNTDRGLTAMAGRTLKSVDWVSYQLKMYPRTKMKSVRDTADTIPAVTLVARITFRSGLDCAMVSNADIFGFVLDLSFALSKYTFN
jgi:hypothetical protein